MEVNLEKPDLVRLVKSCKLTVSLEKEMKLKGYGTITSGDFEWTSTSLLKLTEKKLWEIYMKIR